MKRTRLIVAMVLVLATAAGAVWIVMGRRKQASGGPPTAVVSRRDLSNTVTATGLVRAMVGAEVKVGSRASGRVEKLYANVGDEVRAGQLLALLDDRDLRAKVNKAKADQAAAEAKWREAVAAAGAQPQQSSAAVSEAGSGVTAAEARARQAEAAARSQPVATGSQIDQARRTLTAAQTRLEQARATAAAQPRSSEAQVKQAEAALRSAVAALARVQRGARSEEVAQAEASVRQAQARLGEAEANLQRAETLYARECIAAQEVDRRRTDREVAKAELETAHERVNLLRTQTLPEDLEKAEADVARARATLEEAESATVQVELRGGDVDAAGAEVQRAEAALRAAEAGRSQDEIRRQELSSALAESDQARAGYHSALADTVQVELKGRAAEAARAQVLQAQAALSSAETELSYARIVAPIDGIIASVATQEGETVSAGLQAPTFVTIIDLNRLEVDAYVDETDIGKVKVGQEATFTVDAYPDRDFAGQVTAVYPKALKEQNVVEYDVVVSIADTQGLLKPDMTANVTISAEAHADVLTVPTKAIRREGGHKVVYVLVNGKPVARPVTTGVRGTEYTEILSGVAEGTHVLMGESPAAGGQTKASAPSSPQGR